MILSSFPKFKAIEEAVENGGVKLTTVIRLAPYPFNVMSVLFATTSVTFTRYTQATSLALIKIILHVYIGSTVRDLAETNKLTPARVFALSIGLVIATGVFIYLTLLVRRVLREAHIVDEGEEVPLHLEEPDDVELGEKARNSEDGNLMDGGGGSRQSSVFAISEEGRGLLHTGMQGQWM
ncbi:hypothetical protein SpCBS45565_g02038 [Spizellomyces sp. 'palustris']|nr:hypothetical protein SpCBS45565_g02038 [Spizellomyces sp. 'palustris']